MKKKIFAVTAIVLASMIVGMTSVFVGCGEPEDKGLTDSPLTKVVIADFTKADGHDSMFESDGWSNGEPFNVTWAKDNVSYEGGKVSLTVSDRTETTTENPSEYFGGEVRTSKYYGFGDYSVSMKPAAVAGTASTFFTCTGPYDIWYNEDGTENRKNPHDEIDIEFLGSDTTKVQFNYFANGTGGHEYMYDLGFDASKEFHDYGFRWTENDITWFVDNKPVYKVLKSEVKAGESWPSEPGRVLMNYWVGTEKAAAWMGGFKDDFTGKAEYEWASTTATAKPDPATSKPGSEPQPSEPIPTDITWDENTVFPFVTTTEGGKTLYEVTTDNEAKKHTVSYTDIGINTWKNIEASVPITGRNHIGMTLTGKTDKPISARINVLDSSMKNLAKKSYVSEGETSVADGALVVVPANSSIDIVVYYEGTMDKLQIMLDSTNLATAATNTNSLEISKMRIGVKGEVIDTEETFPETPVFPAEGEGVNVIEKIAFTSEVYKLTKAEDNSTLTAAYTDVQGKSYATLAGNASAVIEGKNAITFKVKNNGENVAKIRADIICPKGSGTNESEFCNKAAAATGVTEMGNDYAYGGADWFKVAAGETATITIHFSSSAGASGLTFFIDSSTFDDESKHTGEVVFSEMSLFTYSAK